MSNKITKTIAGGLIISTIVTNSKVEVQACDSVAVMETATQASICAGPLAPIVIGGALVVTGITTVIGIKNKHKEEVIYQSLEHLPDTWKPNSVVEKVKPNGKVVQRRFYGNDGKPELDIDLTNHGQPEWHPFEHNGAHKHVYDYTKKKVRSIGKELTEEEYKKYVKDFDSKKAERIRVEGYCDN